MRTESQKETPDFILEQNNQYDKTDTDKLIQYGAHQTHFQHLRNQDPYNNKRNDPAKDCQRARTFHQFVCLIKEEGYQQYINQVFYSEMHPHNLIEN